MRARALAGVLVAAVSAAVLVSQPLTEELDVELVLTPVSDPLRPQQWSLGGMDDGVATGARIDDAWDNQWHILAYQGQTGHVHDDGRGRRLVRYGQPGQDWDYKLQSGDFRCAADGFDGNHRADRYGHARCEVAEGWGFSVEEGSWLRVPTTALPSVNGILQFVPHVVRFGNKDNWTYRTVAPGPLHCSQDGIFGPGASPFKYDPQPGVGKFCQVELPQSDSPLGPERAEFLARWGERFTAPPRTVVRFGAIGEWYYRSLPQGGTLYCDTQSFPQAPLASRSVRHCEVVTTQGAGTSIAVIDDGFSSHPDINGKWLPGLNTVAATEARDPQLAATAGSLTDILADWDTSLDGAAPCKPGYDPFHGTVMAGVAAASTHNALGVAGVAPFADVIPIRIAACRKRPTTAGIALGIRWAAGVVSAYGADGREYRNPNPAQAILMAFGVENEDCPPQIKDAIADARAAGAVVVASAGQARPRDDAVGAPLVGTDLQNVGLWPANCPGVVTVTAHDEANRRVRAANFGGPTDLAAPGYDVMAPDIRTVTTATRKVEVPDYAHDGGTSLAGAIVAGIAALMKGRSPSLSAANVEWRLTASADRFPSANCTGCGTGVVDAYRAMRSAEAITHESGQNQTAESADYISASADVHGTLIGRSPVCIVETRCGTQVVLRPGDDTDWFTLDQQPGHMLDISFSPQSCAACTYSVSGVPGRWLLGQRLTLPNTTLKTRVVTIKVQSPEGFATAAELSYDLQTKF